MPDPIQIRHPIVDHQRGRRLAEVGCVGRKNPPGGVAHLLGMILVAPDEVTVATLGLNPQIRPIPRSHPFGVVYFEKHTDPRHLFHLKLRSFGSRVAGGTRVGLCRAGRDAEHCDRSGEPSQKETAYFDFPFHNW